MAGIPSNSIALQEAIAAAARNPTDDVEGENIWLADATRSDLVAPVTAIAAFRGDRVVLADPHNMLGDQTLLDSVRLEPLEGDVLAWDLIRALDGKRRAVTPRSPRWRAQTVPGAEVGGALWQPAHVCAWGHGRAGPGGSRGEGG